jgi:hypothetical protein
VQLFYVMESRIKCWFLRLSPVLLCTWAVKNLISDLDD